MLGCSRFSLRRLGVRRVRHDVAVVALCEYVVLPVTPDGPCRIPRVSGVRLVDDLVVVAPGAVVSVAANHVADVAAVHVGIVVERALGVDLVVARRKRGLVEGANRGNSAVDSTIAEIPVPVTACVVRVDAGVVADHLNADVADAVVVCVTLVWDLASNVGSGDRIRGGHKAHSPDGSQDEQARQ